MTILGLQGVRGGVGTTSLTAALGWALQQLGETVLVVDASSDNLLRHFFNVGFAHEQGWARAMLEKQSWRACAWRYTPHLDLLPFGQLTQAQQQRWPEIAHSLTEFAAALQTVKASGRYRWILLDLPADCSPLTRSLVSVTDKVLSIATPDANCHIRLHQQALPEGADMLVNGRTLNSQLQDDIYQLWLQTQRNLLPVVIHRDEAVAEALAVKQPPGEYRADALASEEIITLANWCILHYGEGALHEGR